MASSDAQLWRSYWREEKLTFVSSISANTILSRKSTASSSFAAMSPMIRTSGQHVKARVTSNPQWHALKRMVQLHPRVTVVFAHAHTGVDTVYATFAIIRFMDRLPHQAALSYRINVVGTERILAAYCHLIKIVSQLWRVMDSTIHKCGTHEMRVLLNYQLTLGLASNADIT